MANEVEIRVVTNTANADAQLNKLKGTTGGLNKNLLTSAKRFAVMGTAVAGAAVGVGLVTKKVFDMAANLELVENKINIVFGDQVGMVNDWADNVSKRMGLSSTQVAGLAANFADLLIPMQFTREQAAEMSTDIVGLSGALSEWSGGTRSVKEVSDILGKAMLGEREAIKSLGISITEADVKNKILSMSTQQLSGLTEAQAKAIATRDLILEKSIDAQNAYKDNTDGLSVAQAELSSALEEVKEEFIRELTPALTQFADYLRTSFIPMVEEKLIPNIEKMVDVLTKTAKVVKFVVDAWNMTRNPIGAYIDKQKDAAKATEKQREMLDEVNQGYFDFSDAALGVNKIIPITNDLISDQTEEIGKANEAFKRLTAEQYASSVAQQILSSSFADQIEFDDIFDTAVVNLRKLLGEEGQLAALKNELLGLAGVTSAFDGDFDFRSSKTKREQDALPGFEGVIPDLAKAESMFEGVNPENFRGAFAGPNKQFAYNITPGLGVVNDIGQPGIGGTAKNFNNAFVRIMEDLTEEQKQNTAVLTEVAQTLVAQGIQQGFFDDPSRNIHIPTRDQAGARTFLEINAHIEGGIIPDPMQLGREFVNAVVQTPEFKAGALERT